MIGRYSVTSPRRFCFLSAFYSLRILSVLFGTHRRAWKGLVHMRYVPADLVSVYVRVLPNHCWHRPLCKPLQITAGDLSLYARA